MANIKDQAIPWHEHLECAARYPVSHTAYCHEVGIESHRLYKARERLKNKLKKSSATKKSSPQSFARIEVRQRN
jgi:hypothetical protein